MKVSVVPGSIIINDIVEVVNHGEFRAYECDLRSKYPGPVLIGASAHRITLTLLEQLNEVGTVQTLYLDPVLTHPTEIFLAAHNIGEWMIHAEGARYSLYITMYHRRGNGAVVYNRELGNDLHVSREAPLRSEVRTAGLEISQNQHCTNPECPFPSHTAQWCGRPQPRQCDCHWCYPERGQL